MTSAPLGFVGLGRMGNPMAARLVEAGLQVIGFDGAGTAERLPEGARAAASVTAVAAESEVVFLSLSDGAASRAVCAEIAAAPERRVLTVVDLSTIGVPAAMQCAQQLASVGVDYVDAPVSGGVARAKNGTFTVMIGSPAPLFNAVQPLLVPISERRFRVGDQPGQGQAMKLVNQIVFATSLAVTSEATLFGARMGLDPAQMIDILNVSTGQTAASSIAFPRSILPGTFDFGFGGALMAKDVRLYREQTEALDATREVAQASVRLWEAFAASRPGADFTAIFQFLEEGGAG